MKALDALTARQHHVGGGSTPYNGHLHVAHVGVAVVNENVISFLKKNPQTFYIYLLVGSRFMSSWNVI